jgi:hypothetical protein
MRWIRICFIFEAILAMGIIAFSEIISVPLDYPTIPVLTYGELPHQSQEPRRRISTICGHVYDFYSGPPELPGVIVEALQNDVVVNSDITDANGYFLMNVPDGTYDVRARKLLYRTSELQLYVPPVQQRDIWIDMFSSHFHTVIIGVSDYINNDHWRDLFFADDDAVSIFDELYIRDNWTPAEMALLLDHGATKSNIEWNVIARINEMEPGDYFLFYYAGHGTSIVNTGYILPTDATSQINTWISEQELFQWISAAPGPKAIILDSCESGRFTDERTPMTQYYDTHFQTYLSPNAGSLVDDTPWLNKANAPDSCAIMVAATGDEIAIESPKLEHGIFTFSLLSYWDINRDPNKNGFMSVEESDLYVSTLTYLIAQRYYSRSQRPVMLDRMPQELDLVSVTEGIITLP